MEVKLINLTKEFDKQGKRKRGKEKEKVVAVDPIYTTSDIIGLQ